MMNDITFLDSELFKWVILPFLIFVARILDVSIGTLRIVFISRGVKIYATILGFFEVLIWLMAISQIFKQLDNIACYLGFAAGFASGNYVGMVIEQRLAMGMQIVRIIIRTGASQLIEHLRKENYGFTVVDGQGSTGAVKIIFTVIKRNDFHKVVEMINQYNPKAFFTVEDLQIAHEPIFPLASMTSKRFYWQLFKMDRKKK